MAPTIGHYEKVRALAAHGRLLAVGGTRASVATQISLFDHVANKTTRSIDVPAHVLGLAFAGEKLAAACADLEDNFAPAWTELSNACRSAMFGTASSAIFHEAINNAWVSRRRLSMIHPF